MQASIGRHAGWFLASLAVFGAQLALGTGLDFAVTSLVIFLALPLVWQVYAAADNVGGPLLLTTFGKLFVISQFIKVGMGQAADTNLDAPVDTALVLLAGLAGFLLAGVMLHQVLPLMRFRAMRPHHDPRYLRNIGLAALAMSLLGSIWGWFVVSSTSDMPGAEGAEGTAVWSYLVMLQPFAAAVFTARASIRSGGARTLDRYVMATLAVGVVLGIWGNSRTTLLSGFAAYYLTYLGYGGRIMWRHAALVLAAAVLTQVFFFPLIDLQRQLPRNLSAQEYIVETADLALKILDGEYLATDEGDRIQSIYELWSSRHYYGDPAALLDRFTPSQVDEAVFAIPEEKVLGAENLFSPLLRVVPRRATALLGYDYPGSALENIEYEVWRSPYYTFLNYGVFVEVYAAIGITFLPVVTGVYLFLFFAAAHLVYGGITRNYLGAFCSSIFLFIIADSEMGELVARISGQSAMYVVMYLIANWLWKPTDPA